jgi:beta-lactamase class A
MSIKKLNFVLFGVTLLLVCVVSINNTKTLSTTTPNGIVSASSSKQHKLDQIAPKPLASGIKLNNREIVAQSPTTPSNGDSFTARFNALDVSAVQGNVGIGVLDINNGKSWFYNGNERFPMQSVFKLPLGIVVLKQVDEGRLSLDQLVTISRPEFVPAWSPIRQEIKGDRGQFTVGYLLEQAVGISDNTAADALVRLVGSPQQVTSLLRQMKIEDIRVDRLEQQLQPDSVGLTNFSIELVDEQKYAEAVENIPDDVKQAALERYLVDPRDTATPEGMINLLLKLQSGQLLSEDSTALLLQIMTDSPTGQERLKAGLPPGWTIAHKTGTGAEVLGVSTATNDVGIISSPTGKRIAIAVFISGSKAPIEVREKLMAEIASVAVQD